MQIKEYVIRKLEQYYVFPVELLDCFYELAENNAEEFDKMFDEYLIDNIEDLRFKGCIL